MKDIDERDYEADCVRLTLPIITETNGKIGIDDDFGHDLMIEYDSDDVSLPININLYPDEITKTTQKDFNLRIKLNRSQAKLIGAYLTALSGMKSRGESN